jgi:hypothetical protein
MTVESLYKLILGVMVLEATRLQRDSKINVTRVCPLNLASNSS